MSMEHSAFAQHAATAAPPNRFKLLTIDDVLNEPAPEWRVEGLLPVAAMSMIYAPQESMKTFFALDLALSVAEGIDFHGRKVKQGPTVYVLGEGRGGLRNRVSAWLHQRSVGSISQAFFIVEAVQFKSGADVQALERLIEAVNVKPAMLFIDTFARNAVGVDENDAMQVGQWINAVTQLKQRLDVDVVTVHHSQKQKASGGKVRERGSSAFIGAVDTAIRLDRKNKTAKSISIHCEKQKDAEHFKPFSLAVEIVDLGKDKDGNRSSSCVLVNDRESVSSDDRLSEQHLDMIGILFDKRDHTLERREWLPLTGLSSRTFDRYRKQLEEMGYVESCDKRAEYRLTVEGIAVAIAKQSPLSSQDMTAKSVAAIATPLQGVEATRLASTEADFIRGLPSDINRESKIGPEGPAEPLSGISVDVEAEDDDEDGPSVLPKTSIN